MYSKITDSDLAAAKVVNFDKIIGILIIIIVLIIWYQRSMKKEQKANKLEQQKKHGNIVAFGDSVQVK